MTGTERGVPEFFAGKSHQKMDHGGVSGHCRHRQAVPGHMIPALQPTDSVVQGGADKIPQNWSVSVVGSLDSCDYVRAVLSLRI